MCDFVAVYGSLRKGMTANHFMQGCDYVEEDSIKGTLFNLGPFPGIKLSGKEPTDVVLDVYELPEKRVHILHRLDMYEGYDRLDPENALFIRKRATLNSGREAWLYEFNGDVEYGVRIMKGDWVDHVNSRRKV